MTLTGLLRSPGNKAAWLRPDAVAALNSSRELQAPEKAIKDQLGVWLEGKRMLDVAVGTGRTTWHFAPVVGSYIGTDYSAPNIEAARAYLGDDFSNVALSVEDMRDLTRFETGSFDFVLCSYNGLDCIDHDERLAVLSEFRRVCDPSGAVCFSSHNLGAVGDLFRPRDEVSAGLVRRGRQVARQALLRAVNKPRRRLASSAHAMVRDGSLNFWLNQYYVTAGEQLAQLKVAGFGSVEVYGLDGRRVAHDALDEAGDAWFYYLAR